MLGLLQGFMKIFFKKITGEKVKAVESSSVYAEPLFLSTNGRLFIIPFGLFMPKGIGIHYCFCLWRLMRLLSADCVIPKKRAAID
jgi:hypothetical protein